MGQMKIAVLSNVTASLLLAGLQGVEVYTPAGFDTWQQEILGSASGIYSCGAEAVFILLYPGTFIEGWGTESTAKKQAEGWLSSIKRLASKMPGVPIFVSSLDIRMMGCELPVAAALAQGIEAYWAGQVQGMAENVYGFPLKEMISNAGRDKVYSDKMWYLSSCPYSLEGMGLVAEMIQDCCFWAKGRRKKCLVLDLDNTLWGGVAGEDGAGGVVLSSHGEGARYYDMQKCLKQMKEQGVMLAVISKNNPEDAKEVFDKHPFMVLHENDFVAQKIGWEAKPDSIKRLASELNIGLDAFVFLDDNPVERAQMRAACPEVTVPEFPEDSSGLPAAVCEIYKSYFKSIEVTEEDRAKTTQYIQERKRREVKGHMRSLEEYLKNLEIEACVRLMKPGDEARVAQLVGKANQFNVTTIRYSKKELHELSVGSGSDVVVGEMKDRFGEEGLTAVMVLRYQGKAAVVDTFLMSCRVMGRQFEQVIMESVKKWLRKAHPKLERLEASYKRTAKNKPVEGLYESLGFQLDAQDLDEAGACCRKQYHCGVGAITQFNNVYKTIDQFEGEKGTDA
ncbi:MAG: HAD-IIIC family phosphatase [Eubacterium sp.]|nr:HAD-IIIC family phosphatase [Eubacterium sp.]